MVNILILTPILSWIKEIYSTIKTTPFETRIHNLRRPTHDNWSAYISSSGMKISDMVEERMIIRKVEREVSLIVERGS